MEYKYVSAFLNAYTQGKSGGDVCFVEIIKRMNLNRLSVITSELGKQFCKENGVDASYLITTKEKHFGNAIAIYVQRIFMGILIALKTESVNVIYATSDALPDVIPSIILKKRVPRSTYINKVFHIIPKERLLSHLAQKISLYFMKKYADDIIVDNSLLEKELINRGFDKKKLHINYPGITERNIQKKGKKYDAVFMSRLHESKGIYELIDIWKKVMEAKPDATLAIIGDGNEDTVLKLKSLIDEYQLRKNIRLLGYLKDAKAFEIISGASVFVFPSHEEGFGMILGEVISVHTPVIAYDLPVYQETFKSMIHTAACFDTDSFAKKILKMLSKPNQPHDKKKTEKLVHKLSWNTATDLERQIFTRVPLK
jgi:glycosyltransferase involved in cell wall biosynthesis